MSGTPRYRACLVDADLTQITPWAPIGPDGQVSWPTIAVREPTPVYRYMIHDTAFNMIGLQPLDNAVTVSRDLPVELEVLPLRPTTT